MMKVKRKITSVIGMALAIGLLAGCGNQNIGRTDEQLDKHIKEYLDQHMDEYLDQYYQKWDEYYQQWDDFEEDPKQTEPERLTFSNLKSFQADKIDGGTFSQDDIAKKDVTVINFWSMMCGYCIDELPEIAKYADTLPDNVQVITVCLDLEGDEEIKAAQDTLKAAGFKGTTLIKGDGDFKTVCEEIQYTPTTIFVDKEGNTIGNAITAAIDSEMDSEKLADIYTGCVNEVLKSMGKPEIK